MKFTLKNRPKKDSVFFIDYNIWFEGFEKELRERLKEPEYMGEQAFIEEILGV